MEMLVGDARDVGGMLFFCIFLLFLVRIVYTSSKDTSGTR